MDQEKKYAIYDLSELNPETPGDSIVSRTFYRGEQVKAILFSFDTGQELSEHTASMPAIIQIMEGKALLTLGEDAHQAKPGTWVHMPPNLPHSLYAETPVTMLLLLLSK